MKGFSTRKKALSDRRGASDRGHLGVMANHTVTPPSYVARDLVRGTAHHFFIFILFHFHCIRQGYCSGEGLERNIRTIQASPPRNYNRHLNKQTKQNYNLMKLQLLICPRLI